MGSSQTAITYDLEGSDRDQLLEASSDIVNVIEGTKGVKKVTTNAEEKKPVYQFVVDPTKANIQQIAMQLKGLLNKTSMGDMTLEGKATSVVMDTDLNPTTEKDLNDIQIATICVMLPLLFTHSEAGSLVSKGLAVVVIGGLAVATVLTLFIVPVFYELLYFRKSKKQRLAVNTEATQNA